MVKTEIIRGHHFDDLTDFNMKYIGGPDRCQESQEFMDHMKPGLAPCPLCGSQAVIDGAWSYTNPGVVVRCSLCRCSTPLLTRKHWTLEERVMRAVGMWNRRTAV